MSYRVKNWEQFQHYRHRRPPWIRLYRTLLDNPDWFALDGESAKLLVEAWVLASEQNGELPASNVLAWRLRRDIAGVERCLEVLCHNGFLYHASNVLAHCEHDASEMLLQSRVEKSRVELERAEPGTKKSADRKTRLPDDWKPTDAHRTLAERERVDVEREAERFQNHHVAKGSKFVCWDRAFSNWLTRASDFKPQQRTTTIAHSTAPKAQPLANGSYYVGG